MWSYWFCKKDPFWNKFKNYKKKYYKKKYFKLNKTYRSQQKTQWASRKVKIISKKVLTKVFINNYDILNVERCFSLEESLNYLVFQVVSSYVISK